MLDVVYPTLTRPLLQQSTPYCLVDGVLVEPVGAVWVAYSPASGETVMLNNESAAIIEVLREGAGDAASVSAELAEDCGVPLEQLQSVLEPHWQQLLTSGLVRCWDCAARLPRSP